MLWANNPKDLEVSVEKRSGNITTFYRLMEDIANAVGGLYLGHSEVKESEEADPVSFEISFAFLCADDRNLFVERARMAFPDVGDVSIRGLPEE